MNMMIIMASLIGLCQGYTLTGVIRADKLPGHLKSEVANIRVIATSKGNEVGHSNVYSDKFSIHVSDGASSVVSFHHPLIRFQPITVRISEGAVEAFPHDPVRGLSANSTRLEIPLEVHPSGIASPYVIEEGFNVMSLFKNPMVIMGLVLVGLVSIMGKLQPPAEKAE